MSLINTIAIKLLRPKMSQSLEERLRANASAFEGLLSLIPAKYYYDEATAGQWRAKKKSRRQAQEDRHKKLDPDQMEDTSALDALQRREQEATEEVLPTGPSDSEVEALFDDEGNRVAKIDIEEPVPETSQGAKIQDRVVNSEATKVNTTDNCEPKVAELAKVKAQPAQDKSKKQKNIEELRMKLQAKIQDLRAKRKAPGTNVDGAASSREIILEQRKRKQELKRQRKLLEQEGDDENDEDGEEEEGDSSDSSDEDLEEPVQKKPHIDTSGIMFQSIEFDDGSKTTSDLTRIRNTRKLKNKGPNNNDVKAHLKLLEQRKNKLADKNEQEVQNLEDKQTWQRAMLQAEGVKIKDDEKLLRKALKRKEAKKRKSTQEWKERSRIMKTTMAEKQKRREENLQIRKDNKGKKKNQRTKMKRKVTGTVGKMPMKKINKKRAGFEGRLKRK